MPPSLHRLGGPLAALLTFAALALVLTQPLGAHLGTALPDVQPACRFDSIFTTWTLAWQSHALATAPTTLLDANIYYPATRTLFYGPTGIGALPFFAPVFLATGSPVLAVNMVFLGGIVLTAWSLHLVVVHWTGRWLAGLIAGACFLATRWVLWFWIPTAPHHAILCWFPVIVLLASAPTRSFGRALPLLPLVVLQCAVDVVYVAPAVLIPLGVLAVARLVRPATRTAGLHLAGVLALAVLVLAPLYAGLLDIRLTNPDLRQQTVWRGTGTVPPVSIPRSYLSGAYPTAVPAAAWALAAVGGWLHRRRRRHGASTLSPVAWRHATFWTVAGLCMATSPLMVWGVGGTIALPHAALPIYEVIRAPARLGIAALIGLSLLAGLGFAECLHAVTAPAARRLRPLALATAVLLAMYAEYRVGFGWRDRAAVPATYPIHENPAPDPTVGRLLSEGTGPVLELPLSRNGVMPPRHARAMFRSIAHWRPLLNGYASYWPAGFAERMALANRLPDADALATLRQETGLTTIVVHTAELIDPAERAAWRDAAARTRADLRLTARAGDVLVFAVGPDDRS